MSDQQPTSDEIPLSPLLVSILESNSRQLASTTNHLLDSYREEALTGWATVVAIKVGILELFAGPYAPSESAVIAALRPDDELVQRMREQIKREGYHR